MKPTANAVFSNRRFLLASAVIATLVLFPIFTIAQGSQGQNAVCTTGPSCSPTIGTSAFIDASVFAFQNGTICSVIYSILQSPSYSASVAASSLAITAETSSRA